MRSQQRVWHIVASNEDDVMYACDINQGAYAKVAAKKVRHSCECRGGIKLRSAASTLALKAFTTRKWIPAYAGMTK